MKKILAESFGILIILNRFIEKQKLKAFRNEETNQPLLLLSASRDPKWVLKISLLILSHSKLIFITTYFPTS